MNKKVSQPLRKYHSFVVNYDICEQCAKPFFREQRVILTSTGALHATCALRGTQVPQGIIDYIKPGRTGPYPVVLTNGEHYTLKDVGLSEMFLISKY